MMRTGTILLFGFILFLNLSSNAGDTDKITRFNESFVRISQVNPFYFELTGGETYIPIGANICWAKDMATLESYFRKLSENGGNFVRIWLNFPNHEIETEYGKLNEDNLRNIDRILETAMQYGLKVKMCIESFRRIEEEKSFFSKTQYHVNHGGPFNSMQEYIHSEKGRQTFLNRLEHFRKRYGNHPAIFAWELWNEMNAIDSDGLWEWNEYMLPKVKEMFPENLVMQSLGSFDHESTRKDYRYINQLESNEVAQIHRYLDLGAQLDICKAPMDVLSSDAIDELRSYGVIKPMLLAEVGGVKPVHTGPIELYADDTDGVLLHDMLFAPFFSGSAGPGHAWHWDNYIDKNNLWYHFARFAEAIKNIDPVQEQFIPFKIIHPNLRIYGLTGSTHVVLWCRDAGNDWQSEFINGIAPETLKQLSIDASALVPENLTSKVEVYDPWKNSWQQVDEKSSVINLPDFKRSVVVKIKK